MTYVADILTGSRIVLSVLTLAAILDGSWVSATAMFAAAVLTDAFDGFAARTWPYGVTPRWKQAFDGHQFDNLADGLLTLLPLVGLSVIIWWWRWVALVVVVGTIAILIAIPRVQRFNLALAEKIDVAHGWMYATLLSAMLVSMTVRTTQLWPQILVVYAFWAVGILIMKWDRATTRPATRRGARG